MLWARTNSGKGTSFAVANVLLNEPSRPPFPTKHRREITTETLLLRPQQRKTSANGTSNSVKEPTIVSQVASLSKDSNTTRQRETDRRDAENKRRCVPRTRRKPVVHTRPDIKIEMAHRRGGNAFDCPSPPSATRKGPQQNQTFGSQWHRYCMLWKGQT